MPNAIRPPGFTPPLVSSVPGAGVPSEAGVTAPEKVPQAGPLADQAPAQTAQSRPAALDHAAPPTGQFLTRLPPAASVARTAYLITQQQQPGPAGHLVETARRTEQARQTPGQNFMSSLTRALGDFFRWVSGLTEAEPGDDGDPPPIDPDRPPSGPGSTIDTLV